MFNIDSYDLLFGLNFLMKIGVVMDVEKGIIQVHMEMNFWVGFGDGVGLLLQLGWLLNEECKLRNWRLVGVRDWMEASES